MKENRYHIVTLTPSKHSGMFKELSETLFFGLNALGCEASMDTNKFSGIATNIVLGTGLFTHDVMGIIPEDSIIYNTEPIDSETKWVENTFPRLVRKFETWDYSQRNVELLNSQGISVTFVPIGFVQQLQRIPKPEQQDIDVLFYGNLVERRAKILDQLLASGLSAHVAVDCYGNERDSLISRAKVVINIHYYNNSNIFEMVRISYLLTNKKAVVSEINAHTDMDLRLRQAVVGVDYDELVPTCLDLVGDGKRRVAIEEKGFEIISTMPEEEILRQVLENRRVNTR